MELVCTLAIRTMNNIEIVCPSVWVAVFGAARTIWTRLDVKNIERVTLNNEPGQDDSRIK